ncbi:hypothetical protein KSP39_PZI020290 [Platanthera zijinensis]|uniref:Uncharacterized protein n=1 Tax=Platanthera zijinensis TaxID=2320716 RepID=A0AAP0AZK7_9ASPA
MLGSLEMSLAWTPKLPSGWSSKRGRSTLIIRPLRRRFGTLPDRRGMFRYLIFFLLFRLIFSWFCLLIDH